MQCLLCHLHAMKVAQELCHYHLYIYLYFKELLVL
jgi:hypothetical protein